MSDNHKGIWVDVDGKPVHMSIDPNMSPETMKALIELVRLASNNSIEDWDNLRVCSVCHQYECVAPETKCWRCLEQEMIDAQ